MLAALILVATVVSVTDIPKPGLGDPKVVDTAEMLSPTEEGVLDGKLAHLERDLGVETAIVTVPDVEGTAKEFAPDLFNRWGLGKKDARNGLLILVVRDTRRVATETGYGLEPILPDSWLASVQTDAIGPRFRARDYGGGLLAGFDAIDSRLREHPQEARAGARRMPGVPVTAGERGTQGGGVSWLLPLALGATGIGVVGFLIALAVRARRRRTERCPKCKSRMVLLDEVADDAHLSPGERKEEELDSVNYLVYICPADQATTIRKDYKAAAFGQCPECRFLTMRHQSETLEDATFDHGGKVRVEETCEQCGHHSERIRRTRKRTRQAVHTPSGGGSYWWIGGGGMGGDWGSGSSGSSAGGWSGGSAGGGSGGGSGGDGFDFGGGDSGGGGADTGW